MMNPPLDRMTVKKKLQLMEALWEDLSARAEDVPSPSWHGGALTEREQAVARGEEIPEDWEAVKTRIRRERP